MKIENKLIFVFIGFLFKLVVIPYKYKCYKGFRNTSYIDGIFEEISDSIDHEFGIQRLKGLVMKAFSIMAVVNGDWEDVTKAFEVDSKKKVLEEYKQRLESKAYSILE